MAWRVTKHRPRYLKSELIRTYAGESPDYFNVKENKWYSTNSGSELVTNGTFTSNTTGWTALTSTLSVTNGSLVITNVGTNYGSASQTINTTIGKKYTLKVSADSGTSTATFDFTNGTTSRLYNAISGHYETTIDFIAQATTVTLSFINASNVAGQISYAQNISMFETNIMIGSEITESRNYLNHIVHADADGGVLYVEELPKIEYKNVVKAEEYLGKNALTAWVNFDGTTTPPIINDSYNVSAVIRVSTGVYDVYFKEDMNTKLYSKVITGDVGNAIFTASHLSNYPNLLNKCTVRSYNGSLASTNGILDVVIFGGKN